MRERAKRKNRDKNVEEELKKIRLYTAITFSDIRKA